MTGVFFFFWGGWGGGGVVLVLDIFNTEMAHFKMSKHNLVTKMHRKYYNDDLAQDFCNCITVMEVLQPCTKAAIQAVKK